eukprot:109287-Rhodomonas_salina.1
MEERVCATIFFISAGQCYPGYPGTAASAGATVVANNTCLVACILLHVFYLYQCMTNTNSSNAIQVRNLGVTVPGVPGRWYPGTRVPGYLAGYPVLILIIVIPGPRNSASFGPGTPTGMPQCQKNSRSPGWQEVPRLLQSRQG